jgi:hypothetical protein
MNISAMSVTFDQHNMWVELSDGRTLGVPLALFPRLLQATPAQRSRVELNRLGLHWDEIHEDISVADLLAAEVT